MSKILPYKEVLAQNRLSIDFFLTKSCNKDCYYCTSYTLEMRNLVVDMGFLRSVLDKLKNYKIMINLLGGEPGLVKNLKEVIEEIKKYENFELSVLSNSFVRKRYPEILEDPSIYYIEHLVLDFTDNGIEKLGNYDFLEKNDNNNYNLIIETPNYELYKSKYELDIYHENTILKNYNSRSPFYNIRSKSPEIDRKLCAKFPKVPVIDFENQNIRHCSKKTLISRTFECSQENIDKMMNFELFEYEDYCKSCNENISTHDPMKIIRILSDNHND